MHHGCPAPGDGELLVAGAAGGDAATRLVCVRALGRLGERAPGSAIEALFGNVVDADAVLRDEAVRALSGMPAAATRLRELLATSIASGRSDEAEAAFIAAVDLTSFTASSLEDVVTLILEVLNRRRGLRDHAHALLGRIGRSSPLALWIGVTSG